MTETKNSARVGVIGLGIMGGAYAANLCKAGFTVAGYDPDAASCAAFKACGGTPCASPAEVARNADIILLALPSIPALHGAVSGTGGIVEGLNPGTIVCEMGTLPVDAKEKAAATVTAAGGTMLDCPVSGTGSQAASGDLAIYASGDVAAIDIVRPYLAAVSREVRYVGDFGAGMKIKFVANLLVTINNLATAEALLLAERSGLDLQLTYDAICAGAATSRVFEIRGPMMIAGKYEPATMKQDVYLKDLQLIMDHARDTRTPMPLMAATLPFYYAALAQGRDKEDTASLFAVLQGMTAPVE